MDQTDKTTLVEPGFPDAILVIAEQLFTGPADVYLQGQNALEVVGLQDDYAEFKLIGFQSPEVIIRDYRQTSMQALKYVMDTADVSQFAERFCVPAQVDLFRLADDTFLLSLSETQNPGHTFCLWMPVGLGNSLPVYDYVYSSIAAIDDDHNSGLFILRRHLRWPRQRKSKVIKPEPAWNAGRGLRRAQ